MTLSANTVLTDMWFALKYMHASHWRIQGGGRRRCAPQGSRFFHFDIQIFRNVAASGVGAPSYEVGTPYGKSWIRHCI